MRDDSRLAGQSIIRENFLWTDSVKRFGGGSITLNPFLYWFDLPMN